MIIVAGTLRIPVDRMGEFRPVALATVEATRQEAGCITYSYAFDLEVPGLLRIYEEWESLERLQAHQREPHMAPWRAMLAAIGASGRSLRRYQADSGTPL